LIIDGSPTGVMAVHHYTDSHAYSESDQKILEFVSTEVVKAIQQKEAESALIATEKRFRNVVQFTPIGIHLFRLMSNDDLILIGTNAAAEKILKRDFRKAIGEKIENIFPAYTEDDMPRRLREIASSGGIYHDEMVIHSDDGTISLALDINAFQPSSGEVAIHFQDITGRVLNEEEIRLLNEELEHRVYQRTLELEASNREIEAFAYSVSHDLRAPVRAIKGFSEILLSNEENPENRELIERISNSGTQMNQLINDLLALSRLGNQVLNLKPINLSKIAERIIVEQIANTSGRKIEYQVRETPQALADEDMVRILLTNLINNAIKFTAKRDIANLTFGHKLVGGSAYYFLRDNGIGIDMEFAEKIFSPFERLHATEYEGTGIGLAIVSRVIRRHDGEVWVDSTPGKGSTFYFSFATFPS